MGFAILPRLLRLTVPFPYFLSPTFLQLSSVLQLFSCSAPDISLFQSYFTFSPLSYIPIHLFCSVVVFSYLFFSFLHFYIRFCSPSFLLFISSYPFISVYFFFLSYIPTPIFFSSVVFSFHLFPTFLHIVSVLPLFSSFSSLHISLFSLLFDLWYQGFSFLRLLPFSFLSYIPTPLFCIPLLLLRFISSYFFTSLCL